MEEVILHIGTHKTGSSSIQHTLAGFDDGETIYSGLGMNHSVPILTIFSADCAGSLHWKKCGVYGEALEQRRRGFVETLTAEVERKDRRRLIISAENIWHFDPADKKTLLDYFKDRRLTVRVVCYVREILSFAASSFQQSVKGSEEDFQTFDADFRHRLEDFRTRLPEDCLTVRKYSPDALRNGCVVQDFCHIVGIEPGEIIRSNEGLTASAAKLLHHFNTSGPVTHFDERLKEARSKMVRRLNAVYGDPKIDLGYFVDFISGWEDDYVYLARSFGIEFDPPDRVRNDRALKQYLEDMSDLDLGPLDDLLKEQHVDPTCFDSPIQKMTALYYSILARFPEDRDLTFSDAGLIRDIALKYEKATPVTLEEAYQLMLLARRGRPKGQLISKKILEYQELMAKERM